MAAGYEQVSLVKRNPSHRRNCRNLDGNYNLPLQIFAIGGGGFTHPDDDWPDDARLEDRLLALAGPVQQVRIGYLGHASNDDPGRIDAFYHRFRNCAASTHLPLTADAATAASFLSGLDILYVGGGTTTAMLTHWQDKGIVDVIARAARNGMILSGVSAGAICWFEALLLGTAEEGYELRPGLGLLPGSACPHYRNDLSRKQAYDSNILAGRLAPGLGIDDGVAVHFVDGVVADVDHARGDAGEAFAVCIKGGDLVVETLHPGYRLMRERDK